MNKLFTSFILLPNSTTHAAGNLIILPTRINYLSTNMTNIIKTWHTFPTKIKLSRHFNIHSHKGCIRLFVSSAFVPTNLFYSKIHSNNCYTGSFTLMNRSKRNKTRMYRHLDTNIFIDLYMQRMGNMLFNFN